MLSTLVRLFDGLYLSQYGNPTFSENTSTADLIDLLLVASFDESGNILKSVIEEHYRDGIEGLEDVKAENGKITGIFLDRVNPTLTKRFKFTVTPNTTSYYLINPEDLANFQELVVATNGKKQCVIGLSCGGGCVPQKTESGKQTVCKQQNSASSKASVQQLLEAAKAKSESRKSARQEKLSTLTKTPPKTKSDAVNKVPAKQSEQEKVIKPKQVAKENAPITPVEPKPIPAKVTKTEVKPVEAKQPKSIYSIKFDNHSDLIKLGSGFSKKFTEEFESGDFKGKFQLLAGMSKKLEKDKERLKGSMAAVKAAKSQGKKIKPEFLSDLQALDSSVTKNQAAFDRALGHLGMVKKFESLREDILNRHNISKEEAEKAVSKFSFQGEGLSDPKKLAKAKEDLIDVYRFTGGKGVESVKVVTADQDRASANPYKGTLDTGKQSDRRVIFHEFAHHIEVGTPGLMDAARDWVESRATSKTPQKLSEITGNKGFRDTEIALPDKFISPYVGKVYGKKGTPTEVVSMGVERFHSAESMMNFFLQDPEHFKFTLGAILGDKVNTNKASK